MARDRRVKKKPSKNIAAGVAHVNSSFNNTKILISDVQGNAIAWSSAGTMGAELEDTKTTVPLRFSIKSRRSSTVAVTAK